MEMPLVGGDSREPKEHCGGFKSTAGRGTLRDSVPSDEALHIVQCVLYVTNRLDRHIPTRVSYKTGMVGAQAVYSGLQAHGVSQLPPPSTHRQMAAVANAIE